MLRLAGLAACVAAFVAVPIAGQAATGARTATTTITVTAGKPSELAFQLSKYSMLTPGTFVFKVKDGGVAFHDFEICAAPTTGATKNSCVGKTTKVLHPGQTATLTVKITKTGKYEFLCSVPGHAAAGMKGLIGVGVVVKAPIVKATTTTTATTTTPATTTTQTTPPTTTTPTTTTTAGGGGGGSADGCPAGTTIATSGNADHDDDDAGAPSDADGCI